MFYLHYDVLTGFNRTRSRTGRDRSRRSAFHFSPHPLILGCTPPGREGCNRELLTQGSHPRQIPHRGCPANLPLVNANSTSEGEDLAKELSYLLGIWMRMRHPEGN